MEDNISATDWAYLAGIIDGEGSIALIQRKPGSYFRAARGKYCYQRPENSYQCSITISNTDEKMINWIVDTFNGGTSFSRRREGNRKIQYSVGWHGNESVRWILENTLPFMLTKYDVAVVILDFLSIPKVDKELREILHKQFRNLKEEIKLKGR